MSKSRIDIIMLGSPQVFYEEKNITNKLSSKSKGLLCYIAANENVNREKLAYMFWEGSNSDAAKYNLRYNLWSMNKLFKNGTAENPLFIIKNKIIHFNKEYKIHTDIKEFNTLYSNKENLLDLENLIKLKNFYVGEFLEGFYLKDSLKFNDWIFFEREKYQKRYIDILTKLLCVYKKEKEYEKAIQVLEEMIKMNSLDEELYVELIKIYLEIGDRVSALKQYNRCVHVLREELNIAPKESTEKFLKIIKNIKYNKKQLIYNINVQSNLIHIQNNELQMILDGKKHLEGKNLFTKCIPLENLKYNYITSLIDKILNNISSCEFQNINKDIWVDIQRVNIKATPYAKGIVFPLTVETERNRIYNSIFELLKNISKNSKLNLIIERLHFMDKYSFDFIKYILFKRDEINCSILFTCNANDSKLMELKQYFEVIQFS